MIYHIDLIVYLGVF